MMERTALCWMFTYAAVITTPQEPFRGPQQRIPSKLAAPISPRARSSESGTTSAAMPSTVATATCSLSTVSAAPHSPPSFVSYSIIRVYTLIIEYPSSNGKKLGVERK